MAYSDIDKPSDYFNTVLYTGNGTTDREIDSVGFQPDFTWVKSRSTTNGNNLFDSVRGAGWVLQSQVTNAENDNTAYFTAFTSNGYQLGLVGGDTNGNGTTYVAWNWKAGGTAVSNTDGSITSSVSANTDSGFSIVSYTGNGTDNDTATIGHGLGVAPNMIMVKCRNNAGGWQTSSTALGWNNVLELNSTSAQASGTYAFGVSGVTPSSTTFTVSATSGGNHTNTNSNTYIAYCFAEKKGFSKFGSYTGNGSTNGTFVYCGFRPAFVIIKQSSTSGNGWIMMDNKRNTFNPNGDFLQANAYDAEDTSSVDCDFLSNGFKIRTASGRVNTSGATYIYMAFAENPFVTSTGIPATAR